MPDFGPHNVKPGDWVLTIDRLNMLVSAAEVVVVRERTIGATRQYDWSGNVRYSDVAGIAASKDEALARARDAEAILSAAEKKVAAIVAGEGPDA